MDPRLCNNGVVVSLRRPQWQICHLLCNKKCMKTPSPELVLNCIQVCMWLKPVFVGSWGYLKVRKIEWKLWKEERISSKYREFEKSSIRKIGGKITVSDWSKSKGNDFWFEESGVSNNRVFEKSGFHCTFVKSLDYRICRYNRTLCWTREITNQNWKATNANISTSA